MYNVFLVIFAMKFLPLKIKPLELNEKKEFKLYFRDSLVFFPLLISTTTKEVV